MVSIYSQKSDRDLILACQRREPAAFEEVVKRHQNTVYALLFQLAPDWTDTSDLCQEVFIRVWRNINNLRNPAAFRSWLTQVILNLFFEETKSRARKASPKRPEDSDPLEALPPAIEPTEENGETSDENHLKLSDHEVVRKAMARIPEQLRTSLVLREMEGLNYEEIAVLTKTEMGTVKSRIAQARSQLQQVLSPQLEAAMQTGANSSS
jgi:RNA polymerase sigma-70 factor (ECF subfamily)